MGSYSIKQCKDLFTESNLKQFRGRQLRSLKGNGQNQSCFKGQQHLKYNLCGSIMSADRGLTI